jgi:hypothetical protein
MVSVLGVSKRNFEVIKLIDNSKLKDLEGHLCVIPKGHGTIIKERLCKAVPLAGREFHGHADFFNPLEFLNFAV